MTDKELFKLSLDAHLRYVVPKEYSKKQALYIAKGYYKIIGRLNELSFNQFKLWFPKGFQEASKLELKSHLLFSSRNSYMISFEIAKLIIDSFKTKEGSN